MSKYSFFKKFYQVFKVLTLIQNVGLSLTVISMSTELDADLDHFGGQIETKSAVKNVQDIMLEYNLIDIWRLRNPDKRQFTWRKRNPIIQRRIDFWLVSDDLQDDVKKAEIIPAIKSDHSAISLSVNSL